MDAQTADHVLAPPPGMPPPPEGAVPSLSAAEALAATPFFDELSSVDLARLIPDLEEYQFSAGAAVYARGDPGDGLYLIRSGTARVTIPGPTGASTVLSLEAPAHFGESSLLTDAPHSTTVVAATPLAVWKLRRERVDALLRDRPQVALRLAADLARRLAEANTRLAEAQEQVAVVARAAYAALEPGAQALLRRIAVFGRFDVPLLRATLGSTWAEVPFELLVDEAVFFRPAEPVGWYAFLQESVRRFLLRQLRAELGDRRLNALRARAVDALLDRRDADPVDALDLVRETMDWLRLVRLLEEHGDSLTGRDPVRAEGFLRALPPAHLWENPRLVRLLARCCAAQGKLEQAIETYEAAEHRSEAARQAPLAAEYQRELAALLDRVGDRERSLACLARAMEFGGHPSDAADCPDPPDSLTAAPGGELDDDRRGEVAAGWGRRWPAALRARVTLKGRSLRAAGAGLVVAAAGVAWFAPAPTGLSPAGMHVLIGLAAFVGLGFANVLPNYLLALLMLAAWVATGTLPADVAASGFAGATWFLLLASMAVGAAVARSGLLYRGAVELVRRLPPSHRIRCLTLGALGLVLSPGMPDPAGRLLLAAPLAQDISETLRYRDRSGGSAGLALATFVGFGLMGSLFLTGSTGALLAYGLLPAETRAEVNWVRWTLAALVPCLVLFALCIAFVLLRYRPEKDDGLPEATLRLQQRVLGPVSRDERAVLTVLAALLIGFSTQALHGIAPAWIAVGAVAVLFLLGALDDETVRHGVKLDFLLYVGVLLGFGPMFAHVGLDRWLADRLTGVAGAIDGNAALFIVSVAGMAALTGIALRPSPIALLVGVALFPTAASAGVDPWVVLFVVMLSNNLWLYPEQNVLYQAVYHATGERAFSHRQVRPFAFAYPTFVLIAVLAAVPYWRLIGLIG